MKHNIRLAPSAGVDRLLLANANAERLLLEAYSKPGETLVTPGRVPARVKYWCRRYISALQNRSAQEIIYHVPNGCWSYERGYLKVSLHDGQRCRRYAIMVVDKWCTKAGTTLTLYNVDGRWVATSECED